MTTLVSHISLSTQGAGSSSTKEPDTSFSQAVDFIPFTRTNSPSESSRSKGKGKSVPSPERERREKDTESSVGLVGREAVEGVGYRDQREGNKHASKRKHETESNSAYGHKKERYNPPLRKTPWLANLNWDRCKNVAEMLHNEVEAFVKYISPTDVEHEVRCLVVELITHAVTKAFPDAEVHPFGSFETKLYLPHGDIDLVILSQSMACSDRVTVLHALANALKRSQIANKVTIIAKAKVPIVKFVATYGQFNVDISINQSNGINAGKVVNGFLEDLHGRGQGLALRSLIMITKLFLSQRGLNEVFAGGLGSYSIVCLAVSFLQMHPKIRNGEIDAEKNLGVLLMEFFELYGNYFNYDEVGISLRDGGTYYNKKQRGWTEYRPNLLSIEDPADSSNDISKGSFAFAKVRTTLAGAHGILTATSYLRAGILEAHREGRSFKLYQGLDPEDWSILSTIIGVTQEIIDHRRLVLDLFEKKTLQNLSYHHSKSRNGVENSSGKTLKRKHSIRSNTNVATSVLPFLNDDAEEQMASRRNSKMHRDDEEGRYAIEQRRFKKKRKNGKDTNVRTIFTNEEEMEDSLPSGGERSDHEEWAYNYTLEGSTTRKGVKVTTKTSATERIEGRRSYWLSKGSSRGENIEHDFL